MINDDHVHSRCQPENWITYYENAKECLKIILDKYEEC